MAQAHGVVAIPGSFKETAHGVGNIPHMQSGYLSPSSPVVVY
jgi:hypothetical protein